MSFFIQIIWIHFLFLNIISWDGTWYNWYSSFLLKCIHLNWKIALYKELSLSQWLDILCFQYDLSAECFFTYIFISSVIHLSFRNVLFVSKYLRIFYYPPPFSPFLLVQIPLFSPLSPSSFYDNDDSFPCKDNILDIFSVFIFVEINLQNN